ARARSARARPPAAARRQPPRPAPGATATSTEPLSPHAVNGCLTRHRPPRTAGVPRSAPTPPVGPPLSKETPMPVLSDLLAALRSGAVEIVYLTAPLSDKTPILELPEQFGQTARFELE